MFVRVGNIGMRSVGSLSLGTAALCLGLVTAIAAQQPAPKSTIARARRPVAATKPAVSHPSQHLLPPHPRGGLQRPRQEVLRRLSQRSQQGSRRQPHARVVRHREGRPGSRRRRAHDPQAAGEHDAAAGHAASRARRLPEFHSRARDAPSMRTRRRIRIPAAARSRA